MNAAQTSAALKLIGAVLALSACCLGCQTCGGTAALPSVPHELEPVRQPPYRVEPPDLLEIDAVALVPKPPYHIAPQDQLIIEATGTEPKAPINGIAYVQPDGTVNLGPDYGSVEVAGQTIEQAKQTVLNRIHEFIKSKTVQVTVALAAPRAMELIRGPHLVGVDGTVTLGMYGQVAVAGMTVPEIKAALERHLSQYLSHPELSVTVSGYNSKVFYVIFSGGGYGEQVYRLPLMGKEYVLDAIAQLNGLPAVASLQHMFLVRPAPPGLACDQVLPVDWEAITERGETATNYQLLRGDRLYVKADGWIATDQWFAKFIAPIERVFGVTLLGTETLKSIRFFNQANATSGAGGGF